MTERTNDDPFQGGDPPGTREDAGGRTGRIGNTGVGPDWMQDQPGKGREVAREDAGIPTADEREKIR
jgi:hypothetical protein